MIVELIEETVVDGKRLGRHIEHDPRSKNFPFGAVVSSHGLHTVHHRRYGPVFDQGNLGSCTGNACAGAIDTHPLHEKGRNLHEDDAVGLYELATQLDDIGGQYPPEDTGSSGLAVAKAAVSKGYLSAYRHAFSVEEALTALQVGPVITGVNWYEGFDNPDDHGFVQIAGQVRGGHEFEVIGFERMPGTLDDALVVAVNSWGESWGVDGRFTFTVGTWRQLLAEQGDVTVLVK